MKKEIYFKSENKKDDIHASIYECENPKLILQVLHGMCEHIERYEDFANFLNKNNIILAGNDHIGHGKSASTLGYFGDGDNIEYAIKDVHQLSSLLKEEYNLPIIYLGHSMGSFILRYYISRYKTDKIILMGTGYVNNFLARLLLILSSTIGFFKGDKYISPLLVSLTTKNFARLVGGEKNEWISYNTENIKSFENDPLSGYDFTVNGYKTLANCLLKINKKETIQNTNINTEIFFMYGEDDPVGNFKKGVKKVYNKYKKSGFKNIKIKFFKNMRHEILNEKENIEVYNLILKYLEE